MINAYAPIEGAEENEKEIFYEDLESICEKKPKHDTLVIMGDFPNIHVITICS